MSRAKLWAPELGIEADTRAIVVELLKLVCRLDANLEVLSQQAQWANRRVFEDWSRINRKTGSLRRNRKAVRRG